MLVFEQMVLATCHMHDFALLIILLAAISLAPLMADKESLIPQLLAMKEDVFFLLPSGIYFPIV